MELVSVVIPAYNAATYLGDALDGALAQTHPRLEVIVVDDGSTDDTPKILSSYSDRIRVVRQPNAGSAAACNRGVEDAAGAWIAFLDADDIWHPMKLQRQIERCGGAPISHTDSFCFGDGIAGDILRSSFEPPYHGRVLKHLLVSNFITKSSVLMRRDLFLRMGGFEPSYIGVEDWPFWLKVCATHELGYLPEPMVRYRVHRKSKSMDGRRTLNDHLRIIGEAFAAGGVGANFPELRSQALASSYQINCHYAAESGDWSFSVRCALGALRLEPTAAHHWKSLAKALLLPMGVKY